MKTRKSNSYMKTGMYLLIGALAGGVLGAGAYMILSSWKHKDSYISIKYKHFVHKRVHAIKTLSLIHI